MRPRRNLSIARLRLPLLAVPLLAVPLLALTQVQCLLKPDDITGERVPNRLPIVRITEGAERPDPRGIDYRVQFQWTGADEDGSVLLYRWAIDDTVSESAWRDTTGFGATIRFKATTEREGYRHELSDWHTFYLRAVDNEYSVSHVEKRHFNALTIAPVSRIIRPTFTNTAPLFQRTFRVRWEGEDLDSSRPDRRPIWYEYKLIRVSDTADTNEVRPALLSAENMFLDTLHVGDKTAWVRVPATVLSTELRDLPPTGTAGNRSYVFAVRAVDEAGAVEPDLDPFRNYFRFAVRQDDSAPEVTISEASLGSHVFPNQGDTWDVIVFVGREYRFRWVGNADSYGSEPGNVNYGLDVPDPNDYRQQDPNGIGGWIGWGTWPRSRDPIVFTRDQMDTRHNLYVHMRDISNAEQSTRRCLIRMHVVDFNFSRFALVVDDAFLSEPIADADHDSFLRSTLLRQLYQYGTVDEWASFGDGDDKVESEKLPDDLLVRYRHIIWNLNYASMRATSLYRTEVAGNRGLTAFLTAGGRLFLFGTPVLPCLTTRSPSYPVRPPAESDVQEREAFYFQYLYMRNTVEGPGSDRGDACAQENGGMVLARSLHPNFPDIPLDLRKRNPEAQNPYDPTKRMGGTDSFEGLCLGPVGDRAVRLAGLDSLYQVRTWNGSRTPACQGRSGPADLSICAWRYECTRADTLARRQHGRVMVFDFQPWWFQRDRLADAGVSAVNWLVTGRDR